MKAVAIEKYGGRDQLKVMEIPKPAAGKGEVLIKIRAAGVNPVDWKIRMGYLEGRLPSGFPLILGWDAAGIVEVVGEGSHRFRVGDEVYAYCRKPVMQHGTYAEYVTMTEDHVALKPKRLSFEEAASIPLAGLTAYQSLFDAAGLKSGMKVLIHAAAGGVGGFAVQLAKNAGAYAIGTASQKNHDYVKGLGADEVIDYTRENFEDVIRKKYPDGLDVAFDTVGNEQVQTGSAHVLKRGGVLVSILGFKDEKGIQAKGVQTKYVFVSPNGQQLEAIAKMADEGKFKTHLAATLPLDEAVKAHEMIESGHTRGKIILKVLSS